VPSKISYKDTLCTSAKRSVPRDYGRVSTMSPLLISVKSTVPQDKHQNKRVDISWKVCLDYAELGP